MRFLQRLWPQTKTLHTTPSNIAPPSPKPQRSADDALLYIHRICPTNNINTGEIVVENQKSIDVLYILISGLLELSTSSNETSFRLEIKKR